MARRTNKNSTTCDEPPMANVLTLDQGRAMNAAQKTLISCTTDLPALLHHPLVVDYGTEAGEDWVGRVQLHQDLHVVVVAQHNTHTLKHPMSLDNACNDLCTATVTETLCNHHKNFKRTNVHLHVAALVVQWRGGT